MKPRSPKGTATLFQPSAASKNIEEKILYFINSLKEKYSSIAKKYTDQYDDLLKSKQKTSVADFQQSLLQLYITLVKESLQSILNEYSFLETYLKSQDFKLDWPNPNDFTEPTIESKKEIQQIYQSQEIENESKKEEELITLDWNVESVSEEEEEMEDIYYYLYWNAFENEKLDNYLKTIRNFGINSQPEKNFFALLIRDANDKPVAAVHFSDDGEIESLMVLEDMQTKKIGTFLLGVTILLQSLMVPKITLIATQEGNYAYVKMGFQYDELRLEKYLGKKRAEEILYAWDTLAYENKLSVDVEVRNGESKYKYQDVEGVMMYIDMSKPKFQQKVNDRLSVFEDLSNQLIQNPVKKQKK